MIYHNQKWLNCQRVMQYPCVLIAIRPGPGRQGFQQPSRRRIFTSPLKQASATCAGQARHRRVSPQSLDGHDECVTQIDYTLTIHWLYTDLPQIHRSSTFLPPSRRPLRIYAYRSWPIRCEGRPISSANTIRLSQRNLQFSRRVGVAWNCSRGSSWR